MFALQEQFKSEFEVLAAKFWKISPQNSLNRTNKTSA
jgi:hypothetical protein